MGMFDIFKRKPKSEEYMGLRNQVLLAKPEMLGIKLDNNEQVYGAIIDMNLKGKIATLVCLIDGSTSLYYSNGGGMIGLGQKYESVAKATSSFLVGAGQTLGGLQITEDFSFPENDKHNVFLLTQNGVYYASLNPNKNSGEKKELFYLYNNVLTQISQTILSSENI